jgi:predicted TIM-barrel fold metal-dependent hydrolase
MAEALRRETGLPVRTLDEGRQAIDWCFERYGRRAVATKNQNAYERRLDYAEVSAADAAPLFERLAAGQELAAGEQKAVEDHLWRYCVQRATDYGLPVKLHTGYFAGSNYMQLDQVSRNLKDLSPIVAAYPQTKFVLMHIAYPYQDELVALAKQYTNVHVDLCWAWIVSPVATKNFVKEYLVTAPCNKLLAFGGDYFSVENVIGHARIARQGLAQALEELVSERWLTEDEALDLVEPLMRGNALALFGR